MVGTIGQRASTGPDLGFPPLAKLARKIVFLADADVFSFSDCRAPFAVAGAIAREIVAVTGSPARVAELGLKALRTIDFDCSATLRNPAIDGLTAWRLARILEAENADAIHALGVKSAVLGALALKLVNEHRVMVHLPDLGWLEPNLLPSLYLPSPPKLLSSLLGKPSSFLLVESPQDLNFLRTLGVNAGPRSVVLGGAGIDPDVYPVLPPSHSDMPIATFIGRTAKSSGLDILMRAFDRVWSRGVHLQLELLWRPPLSDGDAFASDEITQWRLHPGVRNADGNKDVREIWRHAEICVLPAMTRQGLPYALLEAAACGRALVVTECAGGGSFVRHEIEGLVVPRGDIAALADAMARLARDTQLRTRLGEAARLRVLHGFTRNHVEGAMRAAYASLFARVSSP